MLPDGHVVVASGDSATGRWRIVADARPQANNGALTIERLWGAIGGITSTTGDRVEPPLDLQADISDGTTVVWGVRWVDAASVTAEAPGVEPIELEIHEVDGWSHRVVADAFPDDHFAGADGTVSFVAGTRTAGRSAGTARSSAPAADRNAGGGGSAPGSNGSCRSPVPAAVGS